MGLEFECIAIKKDEETSAILGHAGFVKTVKGPTVYTVGPDETVFDAIRKMADENIGSLVVCEGTKPVGIITERHYARNVFLKGRSSPSTRVREVMETQVLFARSEQTVDECMAVMPDKKVRQLRY